MMFPTDFGDERLPLLIQPRAVVTLLCFLQVRQSRIVVFTLARTDDAHTQSAEDSRRDAGMGPGEALSRGLGSVMA